MPRRKAKDSEAHAYQFIKDELRLLGWDVRNPERADAGQVWTQNEALHNPAINESLQGQKPENIVKVTSNVLWVIEAKRSHQELEKALVLNQVRIGRDRGDGVCVWRLGQ